MDEEKTISDFIASQILGVIATVNSRGNPEAALVAITVQYEGVAKEVDGEELEKCVRLHAKKTREWLAPVNGWF